MMRSDGAATFYFIQHENSQGSWDVSALVHFLFDGLSYEDKCGDRGDHYRNLLAKQSASTDLWQKYGVNGFVELEDAEAVYFALRERHPTRKFRLAHRTIMQHTVVLVGGKYS